MRFWRPAPRTEEQKQLAAALDRLADVTDLVRAEQARYESLLGRYHELVKLVQPPEKPALKPKKADPVLQAIADRAGNNGPLRRQLASYAMAERRKGVADDAIVAVIAGDWHKDDQEDEGVPA